MSERKPITVGEILLRPGIFTRDAAQGLEGHVTLHGVDGSMKLTLSERDHRHRRGRARRRGQEDRAMTMSDEEFIASVQGLGPPTTKAETSIFEEVCQSCGGYGVVDNGYDRLGGKYGRCLACGGRGRVLVERPIPTQPEQVIR